MSRFASTLMVVSALVVAGCPVYGGRCDGDADCGPGYSCRAPAGVCVAPSNPGPERCAAPSDCAGDGTCDRFGRCRTESCREVGCIEGFVCHVEALGERCVAGPASSGGAAGEAGSSTNSGASAEAGRG